MRDIEMPPEKRTIGVPKGGWKKGVYLVDVAFNQNNPIHSAILTVKFLQDQHVGSLGKPGTNTPINEELYCPGWEETNRICDLHYLKIIALSEELTEHFK